MNLPSPCVVILVGPGAAGKSTWAAEHFPPDTIVSSDRLRAVAGSGEDDITASADAFDLLEQIVRLRLARGLTTVIDTLGLDRERRTAWLAQARSHGLPCVAVAFDTSAEECRRRNRLRPKRIPADALASQLRNWPTVRAALDTEGYDEVLVPQAVRVVPEAFVSASAALVRQQERPTGLRFGLHLGEFPAGREGMSEWLRVVASTAEAVGFDAIYVMDHFRQIPQIGRAWDDFLESWTTLAYLAACTSHVRLGTLVSGITYRNVAHLGKIAATLDVLSGGRAVCGIGLAWFEAEHKAYGWDFPPVSERYALLEDALRLLPVMWGPGNKPFHGKLLDVPDTSCYPRPLQDPLPLLVGGGGEKRTLRLAARYASAANVFGSTDDVRRKADVLRAHCVAAGREPAEVALTHLSTVLVGKDDQELAASVERLRPRRQDPARYAASVHAGTVEDQIGRFRELAEAGAAEVMIRLPDLDASPQQATAALERMAPIIEAFHQRRDA